MEEMHYLAPAIVIALIGIVLYFIPTYISREKVRFWQVFWLNTLLGWSLLGWVVALIIALDKSNEAMDKNEREKSKSQLIKVALWIFGIIVVFWLIGYFGG